MRADMKIGIAVTLVIVAALGIYYVFFTGSDTTEQEPTQIAQGPEESFQPEEPADGEQIDPTLGLEEGGPGEIAPAEADADEETGLPELAPPGPDETTRADREEDEDLDALLADANDLLADELDDVPALDDAAGEPARLVEEEPTLEAPEEETVLEPIEPVPPAGDPLPADAAEVDTYYDDETALVPADALPALEPDEDAGPGFDTGPTAEAAEGVVLPTETSDGRYIVEEGDFGFAAIASKVYGESAFWPAIDQANPDVSTSSLRVGQEIVLPSLREARRAIGRAEEEFGAFDGGEILPTDGTSAGTYVVAEGDAGFAVIADRVWGDRSLWPAIQQANPGVDSSRLRIGQVLEMPTRQQARRMLGRDGGTLELPATGAAETSEGRMPTETLPGRYIVAEGDGGFAAIAGKVYGEQRYWPAIQQANPDADTSSLRVGQVLVLPAIRDARAVVGE
jgi:hypothetical protein